MYEFFNFISMNVVFLLLHITNEVKKNEKKNEKNRGKVRNVLRKKSLSYIIIYKCFIPSQRKRFKQFARRYVYDWAQEKIHLSPVPRYLGKLPSCNDCIMFANSRFVDITYNRFIPSVVLNQNYPMKR